MKRLLCLGFLAAIPGLVACGDDEPPVTSLSNGDSGASSSTDDTLATDVTASESGSDSGSASVGSSESSGGSSSGDPATGSESSSDDGVPESSSEGGSETSACAPITEDPSALGQTCAGDGDCPDGYSCFDPGGFAPNPRCQILCAEDCECPDAHACELMTDGKVPPWHQCNPG